MSFVALVIHNALRRPGRSLLTATGVAVGVAAVLVLVSLALGFERSWGAVYDASGADLLVGKATLGRPLPTPLPESTVAELEKLPDVAETAGVAADPLAIDGDTPVVCFGWVPGSSLWKHLTLLAGRWPVNGERALALGAVAARLLGKDVGATVRILDREYRVCGRFASASFAENGAAVMALRELQDVTAREGEVNFVVVKLRPGSGPTALETVRRLVRERFPGLNAETTGELVHRNVAIQAAKAMSAATSLVALAIGAVGIINTMLMSVLERRREIAVLLALGWRRARVMRLIVTESTLLCALGGTIGVVAGVAALQALQRLAWFRGKIDTSAGGWLVACAFLLSPCLGAVCGIYPAWRGARVPVVDGLYHE